MYRLTLLGLAFAVAPLSAQTTAALSSAAGSITAKDVAHRIGVIAADSMMGRDTPSRGLELTAEYVAKQFQRFGLRPGGDAGWFQRYAITRRQFDPAQSRVIFLARERKDVAAFTSSARYDGGPVPDKPVTGTAMLVGGPQTAESAGRLEVRGKVVLYVPQAAI